MECMSTDAYRAILNSLSEGVCAVDCEGVVRCFNRQAEALSGIDSARAVGTRLCELFPEG